MTTAPRTLDDLSPTQQDRLATLVDKYLVAGEQGRSLDPEEIVADHPDLAKPLRNYLESLEFLQEAAAGFLARPELFDAASETPSERREIGDFEILREVGRGGMGVVYEARQISLDRRVALKMLPFASLLDSRQIARFRNEAQAAAQLHHPNIVPVFFVGADRGVHYFAMQFIDGQPLDRAIEALKRRPSNRRNTVGTEKTVARDRREDGDHATDLAASNAASRSAGSASPISDSSVMLLASKYSACERGYFQTIAQLGVQAAEALHCAHEQGIVHRDVKPSNLMLDGEGKLWVADFGLAQFRFDKQLTQSGEFVGTIQYMSPEQASGRSHFVDHRTDIYSLGVTLYELLALKHPVRGEHPAAVLLHLERENPYRLRLWNANIPVDLENIVQKAMAKSRDDRYATAQELADDLQRFSAGKPTIARRPTAVVRTTKWIRRHKIAASFVAALVVAVLGLLTSTGMLAHQKRATERALTSSNESFQKYRRQLALSSNHLALLNDQGGNVQAAKEAFQKAIQLQREIIAEHPDDGETKRSLAATLSNFSFFCAKHGMPEAEACFSETVRLQRQLVGSRPRHAAYQDDLALTCSNFASFHARQGDLRGAVDTYKTAIAVWAQLNQVSHAPTRDRDLAVAYNNLGMTQDALGQVAASEQSFREALRAFETSLQSSRATPVEVSRLGGIHNNLGMVLERKRNLREAADSFAKAIACQGEAIERAPQVHQFRDLLSTHRGNRTRVQRKLSRS